VNTNRVQRDNSEGSFLPVAGISPAERDGTTTGERSRVEPTLGGEKKKLRGRETHKLVVG